MTAPRLTSESVHQSIRAAQTGAGDNVLLAAVKVVAGVFGHSYALIADGVESLSDVVASLIVWGGIAVGARPADDDHPYGHGKAESIAAAVVSFMLLLAAVFIAVEAVHEIRTPHVFPASWTLGVLLGVVIVKGLMSRRVRAIGARSGSAAVDADAMHHLSDALTSAAAFIGISVALLGRQYGGGPGWAAADDWAALVAALVIAYNGVRMFATGLNDLMDRSPGSAVLTPLRDTALAVPGVCDVEKLAARRVGMGYRVTVHVQASPMLTLAEAHELGGRVKHAMLASGQRIQSVLVHMEPYEGDSAGVRR